ncbi:MAG: aldose epimerase family protein [Muribaculaceae bacterium]
MKTLSFTFVLATLLLTACTAAEDRLTESGLDPKDFISSTQQGDSTALYVLTNDAGMEVCITNFGARIVSVMAPDTAGVMHDVVLGFDNINDYRNVKSDFGASIGRYANRINQGRIIIDGKQIQLPQNNYGHCLHGGPNGWQYKTYTVQESTANSLTMTLFSPDGDANFPGNVTTKVVYTLTNDNAIDIQYSATTDAKTIINMTNHTYFNLSGDASTLATNHLLYINASHFTPCDSTFMTTGEILPVEGTPMDFTKAKPIAQDIEADFTQLKNGHGYDHNWVLDTKGNIEELAAKLVCPSTGIAVEVYTNEPGIQVYTGNFLNGEVTGKHGIVYPRRASVCLETQHYPDSPNKPQWPSVLLQPGERYFSHVIYKFTTESSQD